MLDVVARTLALKLTENFQQSVVVDNRSGSGSTIATEIIVRANPDGHTVLLVPSAYGPSAAFQKLPYDSLRERTAVSFTSPFAPRLITLARAPVLPRHVQQERTRRPIFHPALGS